MARRLDGACCKAVEAQVQLAGAGQGVSNLAASVSSHHWYGKLVSARYGAMGRRRAIGRPCVPINDVKRSPMSIRGAEMIALSVRTGTPQPLADVDVDVARTTRLASSPSTSITQGADRACMLRSSGRVLVSCRPKEKEERKVLRLLARFTEIRVDIILGPKV